MLYTAIAVLAWTIFAVAIELTGVLEAHFSSAFPGEDRGTFIAWVIFLLPTFIALFTVSLWVNRADVRVYAANKSFLPISIIFVSTVLIAMSVTAASALVYSLLSFLIYF